MSTTFKALRATAHAAQRLCYGSVSVIATFNLIFRSLKQPGRKLNKNRVKFEAIDFDSF